MRAIRTTSSSGSSSPVSSTSVSAATSARCWARATSTTRPGTCRTATAASSPIHAPARHGSSTSSARYARSIAMAERAEARSDWRLAVDIGGTFTDVVLLDGATGRVVVDKTLSTPSRPLEGVKRGVTAALVKGGIAPSDVRAPIVHATTLVTNALIERKTARAALVTNTGFADTLLIRNEHRYDMYDLQIEFPEPPIPRALTFELEERTTAGGEVLRAPDPADVDRLADTLAAAGVEAVAICFLHAYANP